jgi:hypothetical protein
MTIKPVAGGPPGEILHEYSKPGGRIGEPIEVRTQGRRTSDV